MTSDDNRLSAIRWAVPAFIRVDPALGSGPVSSHIGCSASAKSGVSRLLAIAIVSAPRCLASCRQAKVNGVVPLAATAINTSRASIAWCPTSRIASSISSSAPSDGLQERIAAPRDQQQQTLLRPAESRHQFGAVLRREAPGGARAGIGEPAAVAQPRFDCERGFFERRTSGAHGGNGGELALDHRFQDVAGTPGLYCAIARTVAFVFHRFGSGALHLIR